MNNVATLEMYEPLTSEQLIVEQLAVSTKRTPPAAPFPRKYVLSVFVDLQDAGQATHALRAAGFDERGIHVLQSRDFVEADPRSARSPSRLPRQIHRYLDVDRASPVAITSVHQPVQAVF
jgi:hypothetical protein